MLKKPYIEPQIIIVDLDVESLCTTTSTGFGGPTNEFDAPSRRSSSWEEYER